MLTPWPLLAQSPVGQVLRLSGTASLERPGLDPEPLKQGQRLMAGDTIVTEAGGEVVVRLSNQSEAVTIPEKQRFTVTGPMPTPTSPAFGPGPSSGTPLSNYQDADRPAGQPAPPPEPTVSGVALAAIAGALALTGGIIALAFWRRRRKLWKDPRYLMALAHRKHQEGDHGVVARALEAARALLRGQDLPGVSIHAELLAWEGFARRADGDVSGGQALLDEATKLDSRVVGAVGDAWRSDALKQVVTWMQTP